MASSPGPSTPETTPQRATPSTINRSFTVPSKLTTPSKPSNAPPSTTAETRETLYVHPNANIVKFKPSKPHASSSSTPTQSSSVGTLPWASPTEHTVASGQLKLEHVPGSVKFLRSGKFEQQVLPRSNFWCVDGVRKFVCRAREPDTYYRIELPATTEEEVAEVENFKATLQKFAFYERAQCPFSRTFTVELPDEPEVKRKKRRTTGERAKKWKKDSAYGWRPEGWEPGMEVEGEDDNASASASGSGSATGSEDESESASGQEEIDESVDEVKDMNASPSVRKRVEALRSASAPQTPMALHSTPPSRLWTRPDVDGAVEVSELSESEERDQDAPRLRSFQAIPTDMPPSPPDSSAGLDYLENRGQHGNAAEMEIVLEREDAVEVESAVEGEDSIAGAERTEPSTVKEDDSPSEADSTDEVEESEIEADKSTVEERIEEFEQTSESSEMTPPPPEPAHHDDVSVDDTIEEQGYLQSQPVEMNEVQISHQPVADEEAQSSQDSPSEDQQLEDEEMADTLWHTLPGVQRQPGEAQDEDILRRTISGDPQQPEESEGEDNSQDMLSEDQQQPEDNAEDRPITPPNEASSSDPYAAIQARILARRSLSGTTSFHPLHKSPTRSSASSTSSSSATIISNKASRTARGRRQQQQQDDAYASLVNRAYSVFLGPPAYFAAAMLRLAGRYASGAFGVNSMFYVESPIDSPRKVPGSYRLRGDGAEEVSSDEESDWEDKEDDFGVPLNRPASNLAELRERSAKGWDVD